MMPTKTDQGNRRQLQKDFRVGELEKELSPGMAIIDMVGKDAGVGDLQIVPLFRHPIKGGELSEGAFGRWWKDVLVRVGLGEVATGGHGFRSGDCTVMTELSGLEAAAESIGWASRRMGERYTHRTDQ